jgi:hypothetical protein
MQDIITIIYYVCDEFVKAVGDRGGPQARLSLSPRQ